MALKTNRVATPVTGNEAYWGDVKLTPEEIGLINASPTLQSQLQDYGADVSADKMQPIEIHPSGGTYFGSKGIVFDSGYTSDPNSFVSGLSHEIGHYENHANDTAFASRYAVNPRDPNAYNVAALAGTHGEGEAIVNNYQVRREIEENTTTPGAPGTRIGLAAPTGTTEALNTQHAIDVLAGKSNDQDRNLLIPLGMASYATAPPSTAPDKTYYEFYGSGSGVPAPEAGKPTSVTFTGSENGDITSMTERWDSGDIGMQNFKDGKIQSSTMADRNGNMQSTTAYNYNEDGSYSVDTRNGMGNEIQRDEFNADRSGTTYDFGDDGSTRSTYFNASNQNTQIDSFDVKSQISNVSYLDPETGRFNNRAQKQADGSYVVQDYDTDGHARSQFIYDRDGNPKWSSDFDANGKNTFFVKYNEDGSRTVATFNADGTETTYNVSKSGERGPETTVPTPPTVAAANTDDRSDTQIPGTGTPGSQQRAAPALAVNNASSSIQTPRETADSDSPIVSNANTDSDSPTASNANTDNDGPTASNANTDNDGPTASNANADNDGPTAANKNADSDDPGTAVTDTEES